MIKAVSAAALAAVFIPAVALAQTPDDFSGFVKAWHTMESATRVDPDNAIVWFFRADFLRRSPGRTPQAIAACKKALELDPAFTPATTLLEELQR